MSSLRYAIRTAQTPSRRAVQESAKRFTTRGGRSVTAAPTSACETRRLHGVCPLPFHASAGIVAAEGEKRTGTEPMSTRSAVRCSRARAVHETGTWGARGDSLDSGCGLLQVSAEKKMCSVTLCYSLRTVHGLLRDLAFVSSRHCEL